LTYEFPDDNFGGHKKLKAISNTINQAKQEIGNAIKDVGGEMGLLANRMEGLRAEDPAWRIYFHHNGKSLTRLFWQTPQQAALSQLFGGVIIMDTSQKRNKYNQPLTTIVVIDDHNDSRNIAHCLHDSESAEVFEWMLRHLKKTIEDDPWTAITTAVSPVPETRPKSLFKINVVFTDRSGAMTLAIRRVLPDTWHGYCLFHITLNLRENLLGLLGPAWDAFYEAFWYVYRCASPEAFDKAWDQLVLRFSSARPYLDQNIYPDREQWAWAWVGIRFTVGQRSTSRVECEHKNQKEVVGIGSTVSLPTP
jgi:hypothetical protein